MIGKEIISEDIVPITKVKEILSSRAEKIELGYEQGISLDYTNKFSKMEIEDIQEGLGSIKILKVLKGEPKFSKVKVQFSNLHKSNRHTKRAEAPKYWYSQGQEGIFILMNKTSENRYNLRQASLYYESKWQSWIEDKLILLHKREWSTIKDGLRGSIIVDSIGTNKFYRSCG